jgi:hypothetical protein
MIPHRASSSFGYLALAVLATGLLVEGIARAQSACQQLGVDCRHGTGSSGLTPEERAAIWQAKQERAEQRRKEREAKRKADQEAKRVRAEQKRLEGEAKRAALQEYTSAIEHAARCPGCIGGDYCNFFVAAIGEKLDIPYFRDIIYPGKKENKIGGPDEERRANEIYSFIYKAVGNDNSGWRMVSPKEGQELANQGRFVIGVAESIDLSCPGHIAIVAPAQLLKGGHGSGPWIRDAQHPTSSVHAIKSFGPNRKLGYRVGPPIWAVWR